MTKNALPLLAALSLAACGGGDELRDETGEYRLRRQVVTSKLTATLRADADVDLVVALDGSAGEALELAGQARSGARPLVVGIGWSAAETPTPDALVLRETGAQAALELALLASAGVQVPQTPVPVGTRVVTTANAAAGGELVTAPGDFVLQLLRQRNAPALQPGAAKSCPMLVVLPPTFGRDDPALEAFAARLSGRLFEVAQEWPQLDLLVITSNTGDEAIRQELAQRDYRAVLALVDDEETAAQLREQCGEVPLVLIDPQLRELGTTTVGCSHADLGRACAVAVQMLRPDGCVFVTSADDKRARPTVAVRDALTAALGLKKP